MLKLSLCLTDIPKELIKTGKNGKKYLDIQVAELQTPDKFENTHTVYIYNISDKSKIYIGKGRKMFESETKQEPIKTVVKSYRNIG